MASLPFSIFSYSSYLEFLQDAYEYLHSKNEALSYEAIATACGFKSRTHARNIIKGIQKPATKELKSIGEFMSLDSEEIKYLECLCLFEQAQASPAAYEIFQKLLTFQKNHSTAKNPLKEIEVAASLLHMTILSVLDLHDAPSEASAIKTLLKDRYSVEEIDFALSDLESLGFISRKKETNQWILIHKHVKKIDLNPNFFLKRFHEQCLDLAKKSLENETPSERYLVGANFSIHEKVFPRVVQKLNAFLENLMQLEGVAGSADTVVQINTQLIKMTTTAHAQNERVLGVNHTERVLIDQ